VIIALLDIDSAMVNTHHQPSGGLQSQVRLELCAVLLEPLAAPSH
jgi:hypothetical protein